MNVEKGKNIRWNFASMSDMYVFKGTMQPSLTKMESGARIFRLKNDRRAGRWAGTRTAINEMCRIYSLSRLE